VGRRRVAKDVGRRRANGGKDTLVAEFLGEMVEKKTERINRGRENNKGKDIDFEEKGGVTQKREEINAQKEAHKYTARKNSKTLLIHQGEARRTQQRYPPEKSGYP